MKANDIILQAESFLSWHRRAGGDKEANFRWWTRSKDFSPEDAESIWAAVTAPTDPGAEEPVARVEAMLVSGE